MEELRLSIKGVLGFIFGIIAFFIMLPIILLLFPITQWLVDGYFSLNEMIEIIKEVYKEIFNMLTFKEIRKYLIN